jgi:uncharacterized protein (DUF1501 family)
MSDKIKINGCNCSRRDFLRNGMYGLGIASGLPYLLEETSIALAADSLDDGEKNPERILVVIELSGGNDGLNTVVPYGDDEYYRVRPNLGIREEKLLKIDDHFGFHPSLPGFEKLYKDGKMAIVHGCGYENPSLSHFTSMGYWHTGVPNGGDKLGWLGRYADAACPESRRNSLVNLGNRQAMAVTSKVHTPLVFSDPRRFERTAHDGQHEHFENMSHFKPSDNDTLSFLRSVSNNAAESSTFVREAVAKYSSPVDYGVLAALGGDLRQVSALIDSGMPTRVYYVTYRGNSFDTHVHQADLHERLLMYTSDAVRGFMEDLERIGRADDVAVMMFTEFGRRVEENANAGTDHGTATPMFMFGNNLNGGQYGPPVSLTDLDDGNLKMTTDFRRVYSTLINEWMGYEDSGSILHGDFASLGAFGS